MIAFFPMKKIVLNLFILFSLKGHAANNALTVFAASSLTDSLTKIAVSFKKEYRIKINFNFDSSARLARQISEAVHVDLFFSADKEWNTFLENKGLSFSSKDLLSNELVVIIPGKSKAKLQSLEKLSALQFKNLCVTQESTPSGKYAYQSLTKAGVLKQVSKKIVTGDNVRNVLGWVARDEVDLGIVFQTDAMVEDKVKIILKIPDDYHSKIIYSVSLMSKSEKAKLFYLYLQSPVARSVFKNNGFRILP